MDYTLHAIRPLIYKDRENIECFNVNNENALDAAMLELIEESPIIELEGANKYILEIFNNAYYITTLIRMENRPLQFFRNYLTISEHAGSAYYDVHERNTFYLTFSAFTMAMVCNYLCLLDEKYLRKDNIFIKKTTEHFKKFFKPTSSREDAYNIFISNLMSADILYSYDIDKKSFVPRKIDEQAIIDTKTHFSRKYSTWDKMLTNCGFKSKEEFIKGVCRTEEERIILANAFSKEVHESNLLIMGVPITAIGSSSRPVQQIDKAKQEKQHEEVQQHTAESLARIAELEAENESLKKQMEEERQKNHDIELQGAGNDEWVVELLSHYCYEDTQVAQDIIEEMRGKTDPEIADIIFERKQQNKISPKTNNIDLWRVLHAARIYESNAYQNLDTALRRRKKGQ